jgi:tRNA A-37 threonylcarbamoyl transferase component Bud32
LGQNIVTYAGASKNRMTALQSKSAMNLTTKVNSSGPSLFTFSVNVDSTKYVGVFDGDFCQQKEVSDFIKNIDILMDKAELLKADETCYVSRTAWNDWDTVIKRYNYKGLIHSIRHTIKKSRAQRVWQHANRLLKLNIATPRPLGYIERYKGLIIWNSYLITEYVKGQRLKEFLRDDSNSKGVQSTVIEEVTRLLDRLAEHRIFHGDLKHSNILITEDGPVLTDLDAMTIHKLRWVYKFKRVKDMARFQKKQI